MNKITELLKEYVENTTKQIIDNPDEITIYTTISTKSVIIQIKVMQHDLGKIIGRQGRTIEAIKILCLAIKNTKFPEDSRKVILEVLEDENTNFQYN
jgi:predicted RNA-binding protein YlqC (UPF0109 family)